MLLSHFIRSLSSMGDALSADKSTEKFCCRNGSVSQDLLPLWQGGCDAMPSRASETAVVRMRRRLCGKDIAATAENSAKRCRCGNIGGNIEWKNPYICTNHTNSNQPMDSRKYFFFHLSSLVDVCKDGHEPNPDTRFKSRRCLVTGTSMRRRLSG